MFVTVCVGGSRSVDRSSIVRSIVDRSVDRSVQPSRKGSLLAGRRVNQKLALAFPPNHKVYTAAVCGSLDAPACYCCALGGAGVGYWVYVLWGILPVYIGAGEVLGMLGISIVHILLLFFFSGSLPSR